MSAENDRIRRQLGMDLPAGKNDMTETICTSRVIRGEVICQPGETKNGFKNLFGVPVKLIIRDGEVQTYELIWDE